MAFCINRVSSGATLSEQDAVVAALKGNTQIRIMQIDQKSDALKKQSEQAVWYPGISLYATGSYDPVPATAGVDAAGATVTQTVPGGATLSANASTFYSYDYTSKNYVNENKYEFKATQPLINGAWGNASADVNMRIQRLDRQQFTLQQRKDLASSLSDIRNLFWDAYASMRQMTIAQNSMKYAQEQTSRVRARFSVGTVSAIDTMSSALELLKARSALLDAQISGSLARDGLARALGQRSDSVSLPDSLDITIGDLPDADAFIKTVRAWDPQLAIFDILHKKLEIQIGQQRNALLPSLNAQAAYTVDQSFISRGRISNYEDNAVIRLIFAYAVPYTSKRVTMQQTELTLRKNDLSLRDYEAQQLNSVRELVSRWSQEKEKLAIAMMARDLAQAQLAATVKGYELGTVDRLSLINAQDENVSQSLKCLQQQIVLKKLEIMFDDITGTVLKKFGVQVQ